MNYEFLKYVYDHGGHLKKYWLRSYDFGTRKKTTCRRQRGEKKIRSARAQQKIGAPRCAIPARLVVYTHFFFIFYTIIPSTQRGASAVENKALRANETGRKKTNMIDCDHRLVSGYIEELLFSAKIPLIQPSCMKRVHGWIQP